MAARESNETNEQEAGERLGSWKAIAAYLKRDITTVQRWERREGMPVHRHVHDKRGSVYAYRGELDSWLKDRRAVPNEPAQDSEPKSSRLSALWIPAAVALVAGIAGIAWLSRSDPTPINPLANARITPLTDFEGLELAAAISPDGKVAAFLSDRDGPMDVWLTQIGSGEFRNLTKGEAPELLNPEVRSLAFTPDGALVTMWVRHPQSGVGVWAVPTIGGAMREYRAGAVEMDWSRDGRLVYHTTEPGDPTFIIEPEQRSARQIHVAPKGTHAHYPTWSPEDDAIYFVRGIPPDEMDLWRMKPDGSQPEQLTTHHSQVLYPTFLDERALLYLSTSDDGSGPWLYLWDVKQRVSRRISFGVEQFTSLATNADRSRLIATVEHSKSSLWRVPISESPAAEADASRVETSTVGAIAPRFGANGLVYVSAKNDGHAIWRLADGIPKELWSAPQTRVVGGAALSPDGMSIAFTAERAGGTKLHVLDLNTANVRVLAEALDARGSPAWSPDGLSIAVGISKDNEPHLHRIWLDDRPPDVLVNDYSINPVWSPDGKFLVFAEADAGPDFALRAVTAAGVPHELPQIKLPRGARRVSFVPGTNALVVLQGQMRHNNFWHIDLATGERRQLTNFGREFTIRDFDVSPDGRSIVFDRRQENSDLALIELGRARE